MNILDFKNKIENNENFTFVKIGDGEINCMRFKDDTKFGQTQRVQNIDKHPYTKELGMEIKLSFINLSSNKNVFIGDWFKSNPCIHPWDHHNKSFYDDFISTNNIKLNLIYPFESFMLGWGNLNNNNLLSFYKTIKNCNRKKIYVGPTRLQGIKEILNVDTYIDIPLLNAYREKTNIYNKIIGSVTNNCIIFFSVGLMSPTLINDLLTYNNNITMIDIGSGFDSLFIGPTRGRKHATKHESINYFKNL